MSAGTRPNAPINYELLLLVVTTAAAAAFLLWLKSGLPWPLCHFREITGFPCVTCGATRSAIALIHGNVSAAFAWNPLVFAGLVGLLLANVYAVAALVLPLPRFHQMRPGNLSRVAILCAATSTWIYLIISHP